MPGSGLKRPRQDSPAKGSGLLCPYEGCLYRGRTNRAVSIHLGIIEHCGRLRGEEGSDSHEECGSLSSHTSLNDDSSSCSSSSSGSSVTASDSGRSSIPDDEVSDAMDCAEHLQEQASSQLQSHLSSDEGHAASEADQSSYGMHISLGDAAACDSQPSHADSSHDSSSANDDHAHDSSAHDASLAPPGSGSRLTEAV